MRTVLGTVLGSPGQAEHWHNTMRAKHDVNVWDCPRFATKFGLPVRLASGWWHGTSGQKPETLPGCISLIIVPVGRYVCTRPPPPSPTISTLNLTFVWSTARSRDPCFRRTEESKTSGDTDFRCSREILLYPVSHHVRTRHLFN